MDEATVAMLEVEARSIFEGCAYDLMDAALVGGEELDLIGAAEFVADRLSDEYHASYPNAQFLDIAKDALKGYF